MDDINLGARLSKIAHLRPFIDWPPTYDDLCHAGILKWKKEVYAEIQAERLEMLKSYM